MEVTLAGGKKWPRANANIPPVRGATSKAKCAATNAAPPKAGEAARAARSKAASRRSRSVCPRRARRARGCRRRARENRARGANLTDCHGTFSASLRRSRLAVSQRFVPEIRKMKILRRRFLYLAATAAVRHQRAQGHAFGDRRGAQQHYQRGTCRPAARGATQGSRRGDRADGVRRFRQVRRRRNREMGQGGQVCQYARGLIRRSKGGNDDEAATAKTSASGGGGGRVARAVAPGARG